MRRLYLYMDLGIRMPSPYVLTEASGCISERVQTDLEDIKIYLVFEKLGKHSCNVGQAIAAFRT